MEPVEEDKGLDASTEVIHGSEVAHEGLVGEESRVHVNPDDFQEVGVVHEILSEVLAEAEPSFPAANAVKTSP